MEISRICQKKGYGFKKNRIPLISDVYLFYYEFVDFLDEVFSIISVSVEFDWF